MIHVPSGPRSSSPLRAPPWCSPQVIATLLMTAWGGLRSVRFWGTDPKIGHSSGGLVWPKAAGQFSAIKVRKRTLTLDQLSAWSDPSGHWTRVICSAALGHEHMYIATLGLSRFAVGSPCQGRAWICWAFA